MPNNRPPRGPKPGAGRTSRSDSSGGPARGGRGATDRPARGDSPRPARGDAARPARSDSARPSYGDSARPARGGTTRPSYNDSARPARGPAARPAKDDTERPTHGKSPNAAYSEAPRTNRGSKPPARTDRAPARGERSPVQGNASRFGAASPAGPGEAPRRAPSAPRSKEAPRGGDRDRDRPRREAPPHEEAPRRPETNFEPTSTEPDLLQGNDIVFGRHAVMAALEGDQSINKVWVLGTLRNQELVSKVRQLAKEKGAAVQVVERPKLDSLTFQANHQGLVASVAPVVYAELDEVITAALATDFPAILVLDGIEDPHNLGALIRTAEGAGFAGVVIPMRRAVGITPVAYKSSAGAATRVPVARVTNLANALGTMKKAGFWIAGADADGEKRPYDIDMTVPMVLVIGGEGRGLSRLLAEKCDWRVRLELGGQAESLNASVAGGVLMYEAVRQRLGKES